MRQRYLDMDLLTARAEVVLSRLFAKVLACARAAVAAERVAASRRDDLRRALDILAELRGSLDLAAGGELARNLDRLYEFASDRLLQAALGNSGEPIEEAIRVLEPLAEAWHELAARPLASPESSAA